VTSLGALLAGAAALIGLGLWWVRRRLLLVVVSGRSMEPTLRDGQRVLARRASPRELRRGQVVVAWLAPTRLSVPGAVAEARRPPAGAIRSRGPARDQWIVKRVAALAGDPLPTLLMGLGARPGEPVPPGRLVLLGDNPEYSADSRHFGLVSVDSVLGVVFASDRAGRRGGAG
jgi:signal peptidase I